MRQFAIAYQEVTIAYLTGKTHAEMEPMLRAGDQAAVRSTTLQLTLLSLAELLDFGSRLIGRIMCGVVAVTYYAIQVNSQI